MPARSTRSAETGHTTWAVLTAAALVWSFTRSVGALGAFVDGSLEHVEGFVDPDPTDAIGTAR